MKQCPQCKEEWSDQHNFCPHDGVPLRQIVIGQQNGNNKPAGNNKNKWIIGTGIAILVILLLVNLAPQLLNLAARRCTVSLVGIRFSPNVPNRQDQGILADIINDVRNGRIDRSSINRDIILLLDIDNGNPVTVTMEKLNFTLFVNDRQLGTGKLQAGTVPLLKAGKKTRLEIPLDISLRQLFAAGGTIFTSSILQYRTTGEVVVRIWGRSISLPIDVGRLDLPVM